MVTNEGRPYAGPLLADTDKDVEIRRIGTNVSTREKTGMNPTQEAREAAGQLIRDLKPTDIAVWAHQPWHVVAHKMHDHHHAHETFRETILELSVGKEQSAVWWSEQFFKITGIHRSPDVPPVPNAPSNPFTRPFETLIELVGDRELYVVRSGPPVLESEGQRYKIEFTIGLDWIDPDMSCTP